MDGIQPVGAMIQPPAPNQGLQTYADILGIKQQQIGIQQAQQNLETGRSVQQQEQAKAWYEQEVMKEGQGFAQMMQTGKDDQGNSIIGDDGQPDANKASAAVQRMFPLKGQEWSQKIIQTHSDRLKLQDSARALTMNRRNDLGQIVQAGINSNLSVPEISNQLHEYRKGSPDSGNAVDDATTLLNDHLAGVQDPKARNQGLADVASLLMGKPQRTAGTVDAGGAVQSVGVSNFGLPLEKQGTSVTKTPPPGWSMYEDPITHNKYMINQQTGESKAAGQPFNSPSSAGGGSSAALDEGANVNGLNPPALGNAPPQRAPGQGEVEQAATTTNWANHQATITAAREANTQLDQIRQARSILQTGLSTGHGAESLARTEQSLSQLPGLGGLAGEGSKTEKLDLLNKFLERIGAQSASLMGTPNKTDAGAESLKAQIGSIGYGNAALDKVLSYTASQYAAAQAKDRGEQQFFNTKGNSIVNQDQYEQKWRANYDPRIYQLASESPQEATRQLAQMKKASPKDYVTFLKKYAAIRDMGAGPQ